MDSELETPLDIGKVLADMQPFAKGLMRTLDAANARPIPLDRATPEERSALALLRVVLDDLLTLVKIRRDSIDLAFIRAAQRSEARELLLGDDQVVKYEPARGHYSVTDRLLPELQALVAEGIITNVELDDAIHHEIVVVPNHTKLNKMRDRRGGRVRDVIEANRTWHPPDRPGKVVYPRSR